MRKLALLPLIAILALSACNTARGLGRDVSSGGQAISQGATATQRKM